jgi:hypothetical protein
MDCERCKGWMMPQRCIDHSAQEEQARERPWLCMNCGNIVDSVILQNRTEQRTMLIPQGRRRPHGPPMRRFDPCQAF